MKDTASILCTLVGSYPVPSWLVSSPSEQSLADATRVILHTQEKAGIDLLCDGELYRFDINHPETNGMIDYFIRPMSGIRTKMTFSELSDYRNQKDMRFRRKPPGVVDEAVGPGSLDLSEACSRIKQLTNTPFKFTLTGPHMLAKTLIDKHYGDIRELTLGLADVLGEQVAGLDAEVVQIDEANLPGHPDEWEWALEAVNRVLDKVKTKAAVHLCFGNYGGQRIQSGKWEKLLRFFNGLHADHVVLENKRRPDDEVNVLKEIKPELSLGLGVVDVKTTEIETADEIARELERIENVLGQDRLRYIHPDCGLWMLHRFVADGKIAALAKGRDLYLGRS